MQMWWVQISDWKCVGPPLCKIIVICWFFGLLLKFERFFCTSLMFLHFKYKFDHFSPHLWLSFKPSLHHFHITRKSCWDWYTWKITVNIQRRIVCPFFVFSLSSQLCCPFKFFHEKERQARTVLAIEQQLQQLLQYFGLIVCLSEQANKWKKIWFSAVIFWAFWRALSSNSFSATLFQSDQKKQRKNSWTASIKINKLGAKCSQNVAEKNKFSQSQNNFFTSTWVRKSDCK